MEDKKLLVDGYLCNDYEKSYKMNLIRYESISNLFDKLSEINVIIEELIIKKSENKILHNNFSSLKGDNFSRLFLSLNQTIENIFNINFKMFKKIITELHNLKESFQPYFEKYKSFAEIEKNFLAKLKEVEIDQNNFMESAKKAELFTYEFLKKKVFNLKQGEKDYQYKKDLKKEAKLELEKYKAKVIEVNKDLILFNQNQKEMFIMEKEFDKKYNNLYNDCLMIYFEHQEIINSMTKQIKNEIIFINTKKKENEKKLVNYLENYRQKEEVELKKYKSNIQFDKCENNMDINVCFMALGEMEQLIGLYNEADIEYETKKLELEKEIDKIFELDEKISDSNINEIKDILKDEIGQSVFINFLNNYRARGKYLKSERFIILNGEALNLILESAEKKKNYENAKLCIILSQTFYFIDSNNQKMYLFSLIKNNIWLKSSQFWKDLIDITIKKNIEKISNYNKKNINDAIFALILPLVNDMKEFEIDKRIIVKIFDEFFEKYNHLNKESYELIFSNIDNDKNMIEKYRKEYKDNQ